MNLPSTQRPCLRPGRRRAASLSALIACAAIAVACSNNQPACNSPSTGTFTASISYSTTLPVDIECDGGGADASTCAERPHPLDGATLTVAVNGSTATVTSNAGAWSCTAISPRSAPGSTPDGSSLPGTACYLLVLCSATSLGDGGATGVVEGGADAAIDATTGGMDAASDAKAGGPSGGMDAASDASTAGADAGAGAGQGASTTGPAAIEIQLFAPSSSSTDAVVLVHDETADCCTDEYSGTWK